MVPFTTLVNLLPALAALGVALSGIESIPGASAATVRSPGRRGGVDHRHLAARAAVGKQVGAQQKKRYVLHRRADGTQCRVRGSQFAASASTTPAASPTSDDSSASSPTSDSQVEAAAYVAASSSESALPTTQTADAQSYSEEQAASPSPSPSSEPSSSTSEAASPQNTGVSYYSGSSGGWVNTHAKHGNAWPNGNWDNSGSAGYIGNYIGSCTSWYYTWSPFSVGNGDSLGLEYVPMLWGPHQVSDWWGQQGSWPSTVKNALFFNEPNEAGQANIGAGDSVSYWINDFLPVRSKGIRLGGAATTSAPTGIVWAQDFVKVCQQYGNSAADCTPDFWPLHWYDVSVSDFQNYVQNYHSGVGTNLWITEYACQNFNGGAQCTEGETWQLHETMAAWFDQQDYIERYAPFGTMRNMQGVNEDNALMTSDGAITALGSWYINHC